MPLFADDKGNGDFERAPTGMQAAVCSHVVDLGTQATNFGDKRQVALVFQLAAKRSDNVPHQLFKIYTLSFNKKATLRKDVEMWRGKSFEESEIPYDVEKVKGQLCTLNVVEKNQGDKTYPNIGGILPSMPGAQAITPAGLDIPKWLKSKQELGMMGPVDEPKVGPQPTFDTPPEPQEVPPEVQQVAAAVDGEALPPEEDNLPF